MVNIVSKTDQHNQEANRLQHAEKNAAGPVFPWSIGIASLEAEEVQRIRRTHPGLHVASAAVNPVAVDMFEDVGEEEKKA